MRNGNLGILRERQLGLRKRMTPGFLPSRAPMPNPPKIHQYLGQITPNIGCLCLSTNRERPAGWMVEVGLEQGQIGMSACCKRIVHLLQKDQIAAVHRFGQSDHYKIDTLLANRHNPSTTPCQVNSSILVLFAARETSNLFLALLSTKTPTRDAGHWRFRPRTAAVEPRLQHRPTMRTQQTLNSQI